MSCGSPFSLHIPTRLTCSTPAAMNASPSPAITAWAAILIAWRLDAQ